jgi:hypothetical protein
MLFYIKLICDKMPIDIIKAADNGQVNTLDEYMRLLDTVMGKKQHRKNVIKYISDAVKFSKQYQEKHGRDSDYSMLMDAIGETIAIYNIKRPRPRIKRKTASKPKPKEEHDYELDRLNSLTDFMTWASTQNSYKSFSSLKI